MGSITIVNLTDSSIQSAIANANNIHSGINGILPNVYYHHNATNGTGYDVWERWYIPGVTEDFPSSDLAKIGWYIGGAVVTALGIIATALSFGAAAPAVATATATFTASIAAIDVTTMTATAATVATAAAVTTLVSDLAAVAGLAGIGFGAFAGISGVGLTIGAPVVDYLASSGKSAVPGPVWAQDNRILSFTGKIPLETRECTDANGQTLRFTTIPTGTTTKTALPPQFNGDLTPEQFDLMRRNGEIYQIKHRDGEYCDMTQGLVRLNLRAAGGQERIVSHGGLTVDISKIYKLDIVDTTKYVTYSSCLMAGEDEGDYRVYLRKFDESQKLSCCYWQLIPTREGGIDGNGGWVLVDRRYGRFLYWSGSEILQYQSEEVGATKFNITNEGWAEHIELEGMVWNLSSFQPGSGFWIIEQPGKNRICVTARTDQGRAIYARSYGSSDVFQAWSLVEEN